MSNVAEELTPDTARQQLVDQLTAKGRLARPEVAAAFLAVPRHEFAPAGTGVEAAYADDVVVTKKNAVGATSSSISAPWLQAYMLETAQLRPGSRVLEIGSGGYNAALIAELVGPTGAVTSIDIDTDVVTNARTALLRTGYPRVEVAVADAEGGYPDNGPYDAIIVTVETSDIPPAWTHQLAPDGLLVAPVRMRGNTRCLTLQNRGDHLAAIAALQCGFVPMQGQGRTPVRRLPLRGDDIVLTLDDTTTQADGEALAAALELPRSEVWTPVTATMDDGGAFESIHLWLACQPRFYGVLTVDRDRAADLLDPDNRFTCPCLLTATSFAHLTLRQPDRGTYQFGAHGFGPDAAALAAQLADLIVVWDQQHRHGPGPSITVHPASAPLPATDGLRLLVPRRHTTIAITWPGRTRNVEDMA